MNQHNTSTTYDMKQSKEGRDVEDPPGDLDVGTGDEAVVLLSRDREVGACGVVVAGRRREDSPAKFRSGARIRQSPPTVLRKFAAFQIFSISTSYPLELGEPAGRKLNLGRLPVYPDRRSISCGRGCGFPPSVFGGPPRQLPPGGSRLRRGWSGAPPGVPCPWRGRAAGDPHRTRARPNYLLREGTRRLLEDSGEVEVLASVSTAEELLQVVDGLLPDAVLTDIRMPPGHQVEGIEAAHAIRKRHRGIGVVVLSQHSDAAYALQLLKHGTDGLGYLLKSKVGELDELLHALREVAAGRSVIDPGVVEPLVDYRARQTDSPLGRLGEREIDVLRVMAEGKSNSAIGETLHLSESSVEKYVNSIFSKLGLTEERSVSRRVAAVLAYLHDAGRPGSPDSRPAPHPLPSRGEGEK